MNNIQQQPQQPYRPVYEEEGLDLKKYFFMVLAHWYWFVLSVGLAVTIGFLINRYTKPVYEVSSTLIIGDEPTASEQMFSDIRFFRLRQLRQNVQNEIIKLKSYELNYRTMQELDFDITYAGVGRSGIKEVILYNRAPFEVVYDTTENNVTGQKIYVDFIDQERYKIEINDNNKIEKTLSIGEWCEIPGFRFKLILKEPENFDPTRIYNKHYFVLNSKEQLASRYRSSLTAEPLSEEVSIVKLTAKGPNVEQLARYLNKLSEVFIIAGLEEKNRQSENAIGFIDGLIGNLIDSLSSSGDELQQFRVNNEIINMEQEGQALFTKIQNLQNQKASELIKVKYFDYLADYITHERGYGEVMMPSIVGIQDQVLNNLVSKINELYVQRSVLEYSTREGSPSLAMAESEIATTRKALKEHIQNQKEITNITLSDLDKRLAEAEQEIRKLPAKEQQFLNMTREFDVNNQFYTYLLQKRAEAGIQRASNVPDNKILDEARPQSYSQVKPKTNIIYMSAFVVGLLIPFVFLLIWDYLNDQIEDLKYIEDHTQVPILGSIGHSKSESSLPVIENPKSVLAEAFRAIRTNLKYVMPEKDQKVVTITSTVTAEGKTFCAVNLSSIIALSNRKTLLIGLDLRRPGLHRIFNLNNETGISTYLIGQNTAEEIIQTSTVDNLFICPSGPTPPNPAELIDSKRMKEFMDYARKNYDYIILDTPPVAMVTDALLISPESDITVFVVRHSFSKKNVLNMINELYQQKKIENLSLLINDIRPKGIYGYGYRYKYHYSYGYYSGYTYKSGYFEEE